MIRRLLVLALLTSTALTAGGCDFGSGTAPKTVDWAALGKTHLNCAPQGGNAIVLAQERHNVAGSDAAEHFVAFHCGAGQPGQLEVFPGDLDPVRPNSLAVLAYEEDEDAGKLLDLNAVCLYFTGRRVIIRARRLGPAGGGTVIRVATWNGKGFDVAPDIVARKVDFPGCR